MQKLSPKKEKLANSLLKFRELYLKVELRQIKAKVDLDIYAAVFPKLDERKKTQLAAKKTLTEKKVQAEKNLETILYQKRYLSSAVNILLSKVVKSK